MNLDLLKTALVNANWQQLHTRVRQPKPPKNILSWLADEGSLTQRLIEFSHNHFKVQLLKQQQEAIIANEASALKQEDKLQATVREVLLYCHEKAVVFARTVIPLNTLTGKQQELARLDNKPLGAYLFAQKDMVRDPIEYTQIQLDDNTIIWGRRSVFYLAGKPLLVTEIFLPDLFS